MRLAYFDCIAGISGDSALGALVDAGADRDELRAHLATLPLEPFELEFEEVDERGVRAIRAEVRTSGTAGVIRTYSSVRALLDASDLPPDAMHLAHRIFRRLAEAEARVQRRDIETVTFHRARRVGRDRGRRRDRARADDARRRTRLLLGGADRSRDGEIRARGDADPLGHGGGAAPGRARVLPRGLGGAHDGHGRGDPCRDRGGVRRDPGPAGRGGRLRGRGPGGWTSRT